MYKVVNGFVDTQDSNRRYKVGDVYPEGGHKPVDERIKALSSKKNKRKRVFIEKVEKNK